MMFSGLEDRAAAIDALLAVARRELLLLAVASGAHDDDGGAVAAARLRWAIGSVRQLIARGAPGDAAEGAAGAAAGDAAGVVMDHRARALDRLANRAQRWLTDEPPRSLRDIACVIERLAARQAERPRGIDASHASLVELDLDDLELGHIALRGALLTDLALRRARCDAADARGARWLRCQLEGCSLAMAVFSGGRLEHCDLSRANLEGTSWHRAALSNSQLRRALLVDARLDRVALVDCNLRGADLAIHRSPHVASLAGARFVRCDLRETRWTGRTLDGALFLDCVGAVTGVASRAIGG